MKQPKEISISSKVAALDAAVAELRADITMIREKGVTVEQITQLLDEQGKHLGAAVEKSLADQTTGMKQYIDDRIVGSFTKGIKQYDETLKARFLSRDEAESASYGTGPNGEKIRVTGGKPGQIGGNDFVGTLLNKVMEGIGGGGSSGNSTPTLMAEMAENFQKDYDQRLRLEFRNFLKKQFALPAASGHVQLTEG